MDSDKQIVYLCKNGIAEFFEVGANEFVTADNFCPQRVADAEKMMPRRRSAPVRSIMHFEDSDSDDEDTVYVLSAKPQKCLASQVSVAEGQSEHSIIETHADVGKAVWIDWWFDYSRFANTANITCPVFYVDGCTFKVMLRPAFRQERKKKNFNRFLHSDGKVLACLKATSDSGTAPNLTLNVKVGDRSVVEGEANDFSQKPTLKLNQEIDLNVANSCEFQSQWVKLSIEFVFRTDSKQIDDDSDILSESTSCPSTSPSGYGSEEIDRNDIDRVLDEFFLDVGLRDS